MHDSDYDTDSDDEFTNEQKVAFLNNLVVKHEKLIKNYLKDHDILEAHKTKIDMLNVERTNLLEKKKIRFLEFEHHYFLEKNNALTQEMKTNKPSSSVSEIFHPETKVLNEILINAKPMVIKRFRVH